MSFWISQFFPVVFSSVWLVGWISVAHTQWANNDGSSSVVKNTFVFTVHNFKTLKIHYAWLCSNSAKFNILSFLNSTELHCLVWRHVYTRNRLVRIFPLHSFRYSLYLTWKIINFEWNTDFFSKTILLMASWGPWSSKLVWHSRPWTSWAVSPLNLVYLVI